MSKATEQHSADQALRPAQALLERRTNGGVQEDAILGTNASPQDLLGMEHSKDHGIVRDARGEDQPKDKSRAHQASKTPAAGPHAKPELTDDSKTPGAGALPAPGKSDDSTCG